MWLHWLLQVEKLENTALKQLFDRKRVKDEPKRLYQRVSAQFCDLICRVGFQKEFAPPAGNTNVKSFRTIIRFMFFSNFISCKSEFEMIYFVYFEVWYQVTITSLKMFSSFSEQRYGSGIYFSSTMDGAMKLWNEQEHEHYIYIIQALVLTGKSTDGSPHLILPPAMNDDNPLNRYDSVNHRKQTYVIFSGQQALPEYLFICAITTRV